MTRLQFLITYFIGAFASLFGWKKAEPVTIKSITVSNDGTPPVATLSDGTISVAVTSFRGYTGTPNITFIGGPATATAKIQDC